MSRIEVDRERCVGSGTCEMIAPAVFEVRDDGMAVVLRPQTGGDDAEAAEEAVRACPTQALELTADTGPSGARPGSGTPSPPEGLGAAMEQPRASAADDAPPVSVEDVPGEQRYEIREGDRVLGIAAYRRHGEVTEFVHTEVDPGAGRSGVGSALVRAALDDVRSRGGSVVPRCPFVRGWIDRHPEYADLVASRHS